MVFRLPPPMPAGAYQTFGFASPAATHRRPATCAEIACPNRERGWVTRLHVHDGARLGLLRDAVKSLRLACTEELQGDFLAFTFAPGQDCFDRARHTIAIQREAIYYTRPGDFRTAGQRSITRVLTPDNWLDSFGEHQARLADRINQG